MSHMKTLVSYYGGRERRRHNLVWGFLAAVIFAGLLCAGTMAAMLCLLYERIPN